MYCSGPSSSLQKRIGIDYHMATHVHTLVNTLSKGNGKSMKMKYSTHLLTSIGFSSLQIHKPHVKQLLLSSTAMHDGNYKYKTKIYTR